MDSLPEYMLINQFVQAAPGCTHDQARQLLQVSNWQFQKALSLYHQETSSSSSPYHQDGRFNSICNTSTKEAAYNPQVEAISPTFPDEESRQDSSPSRPSKDELLANISKIDRELSQTETRILQLRKKQAELEAATRDSLKIPNESVDSSSETRQLSNAQIIYSENRKKARESHEMLGRLGPKINLPLYNQPSDTLIYHENMKKFKMFKPRLIQLFKKRHGERKAREKYLTQTYEKLMQDWLKKLEKRDSNPSKKAKDNKTREFFEKQFSELRKQREDKERLSRAGQRIRSDADMEEIMDGLQEQELEDRKMRSYAVVPPIMYDNKAKRYKFLNKNGLVENPLEEYKELQYVNIWTDHEKEIFREKFLQHPKNFGLIASYLEHKSVADCVQYYYLSKKRENYKQLLRRHVKKRTRGSVKSAAETANTSSPQIKILTRVDNENPPKARPNVNESSAGEPPIFENKLGDLREISTSQGNLKSDNDSSATVSADEGRENCDEDIRNSPKPSTNASSSTEVGDSSSKTRPPTTESNVNDVTGFKYKLADSRDISASQGSLRSDNDSSATISADEGRRNCDDDPRSSPISKLPPKTNLSVKVYPPSNHILVSQDLTSRSNCQSLPPENQQILADHPSAFPMDTQHGRSRCSSPSQREIASKNASFASPISSIKTENILPVNFPDEKPRFVSDLIELAIERSFRSQNDTSKIMSLPLAPDNSHGIQPSSNQESQMIGFSPLPSSSLAIHPATEIKREIISEPCKFSSNLKPPLANEIRSRFEPPHPQYTIKPEGVSSMIGCPLNYPSDPDNEVQDLSKKNKRTENPNDCLRYPPTKREKFDLASNMASASKLNMSDKGFAQQQAHLPPTPPPAHVNQLKRPSALEMQLTGPIPEALGVPSRDGVFGPRVTDSSRHEDPSYFIERPGSGPLAVHPPSSSPKLRPAIRPSFNKPPISNASSISHTPPPMIGCPSNKNFPLQSSSQHSSKQPNIRESRTAPIMSSTGSITQGTPMIMAQQHGSLNSNQYNQAKYEGLFRQLPPTHPKDSGSITLGTPVTQDASKRKLESLPSSPAPCSGPNRNQSMIKSLYSPSGPTAYDPPGIDPYSRRFSSMPYPPSTQAGFHITPLNYHLSEGHSKPGFQVESQSSSKQIMIDFNTSKQMQTSRKSFPDGQEQHSISPSSPHLPPHSRTPITMNPYAATPNVAALVPGGIPSPVLVGTSDPRYPSQPANSPRPLSTDQPASSPTPDHWASKHGVRLGYPVVSMATSRVITSDRPSSSPDWIMKQGNRSGYPVVSMNPSRIVSADNPGSSPPLDHWMVKQSAPRPGYSIVGMNAPRAMTPDPIQSSSLDLWASKQAIRPGYPPLSGAKRQNVIQQWNVPSGKQSVIQTVKSSSPRSVENRDELASSPRFWSPSPSYPSSHDAFQTLVNAAVAQQSLAVPTSREDQRIIEANRNEPRKSPCNDPFDKKMSFEAHQRSRSSGDSFRDIPMGNLNRYQVEDRMRRLEADKRCLMPPNEKINKPGPSEVASEFYRRGSPVEPSSPHHKPFRGQLTKEPQIGDLRHQDMRISDNYPRKPDGHTEVPSVNQSKSLSRAQLVELGDMEASRIFSQSFQKDDVPPKNSKRELTAANLIAAIITRQINQPGENKDIQQSPGSSDKSAENKNVESVGNDDSTSNQKNAEPKRPDRDEGESRGSEDASESIDRNEFSLKNRDNIATIISKSYSSGGSKDKAYGQPVTIIPCSGNETSSQVQPLHMPVSSLIHPNPGGAQVSITKAGNLGDIHESEAALSNWKLREALQQKKCENDANLAHHETSCKDENSYTLSTSMGSYNVEPISPPAQPPESHTPPCSTSNPVNKSSISSSYSVEPISPPGEPSESHSPPPLSSTSTLDKGSISSCPWMPPLVPSGLSGVPRTSGLLPPPVPYPLISPPISSNNRMEKNQLFTEYVKNRIEEVMRTDENYSKDRSVPESVSPHSPLNQRHQEISPVREPSVRDNQTRNDASKSPGFSMQLSTGGNSAVNVLKKGDSSNSTPGSDKDAKSISSPPNETSSCNPPSKGEPIHFEADAGDDAPSAPKKAKYYDQSSSQSPPTGAHDSSIRLGSTNENVPTNTSSRVSRKPSKDDISKKDEQSNQDVASSKHSNDTEIDVKKQELSSPSADGRIQSASAEEKAPERPKDKVDVENGHSNS